MATNQPQIIVSNPELPRCHTIIMVNFTKCMHKFSHYKESLILYWMTLVSIQEVFMFI